MPNALKSAQARLAYLCLDFGIALHATKGAAVHVRSITRALAQTGFSLEVLCARAGMDEHACGAFDVAWRELPLGEEVRRLQKSLRAFYGCELRLPAEVRQAAINRDAYPLLVDYLRQTRPAALVERLSLLGVAGVRAARHCAIPHLLEVNALLSQEARAHRSLSDIQSATLAEDEVLSQTDHIFCVSEELRRAILARGVEAHKVEVLANGFDPKLFRPRRATALRRRLGVEEAFVLGTVGSLKPWHGISVLLEAFERFCEHSPRSALLLVGEGPEAATVRGFAQTHPHLHIVSTGGIPHEQVASYLGAMDVAVAPYLDSGAFYFSPMKVYEYLAAARPVVASRVGQISQLLKPGRDALLVPPGNVEALVRAFSRLERSRALRQRLAENGRKAVAGRTWKANARRIAQVVAEVAR